MPVLVLSAPEQEGYQVGASVTIAHGSSDDLLLLRQEILNALGLFVREESPVQVDPTLRLDIEP